MKKKLLLMVAIASLAGKTPAQQVLPCGRDAVRNKILAAHPELPALEANYEAQIREGLKKLDFGRMTKRTTDTSGDQDFWYDIPIVVHIINDFGVEYLPDDSVFDYLKDWNIVYAKQNYDTNNVIPTFAGNIPGTNVRYIGNPHIRLHLATIDPLGNPTKGITRRRNYLTYIGGEVSKFDQWPPTSYVNIWVVNTMSQGNQEAAAYAFEPPEAALDPYGDGIICLWDYLGNAYTGYPAVSKTINHEMGHIFNLYHPWGNTNNPQVALGDDEVDDTPPTWGHLLGGCDYGPSSDDNSLYDTLYATNYYKTYLNVAGGDSLVNYPDTTNAQNIMDYEYCARMFTYGQVQRMHAALNNTLAGRTNLWTDSNLMTTGVIDANYNYLPRPDLKPIPEFAALPVNGTTSITNYQQRMNYFVLPGAFVKFQNESWNDTLTSLSWVFSNGASIPSQTVTTNIENSSVTNSFSDGGWVSLTMQATGNNSGDTTVTWPNAVFVANPTATQAQGYLQDFNPATSADVNSWPFFNYYNNEFKWQLNNSVGFGDNNSIEYLGYDNRIIQTTTFASYPYTGTPGGDFDDLFSVPFNLSNFTDGACFLNFLYSGASRSSNALDYTDTLDIDYITKTGNWTNIAHLTGAQIANMGTLSTSFTPSGSSQWTMEGVAVPSSAITPYTVFRFRYRPNVSLEGESSGNNFYMDNVHFSQWPAAVENVSTNNLDVVLMPNPTSGDAYVVVNDANTSAKIIVSDVTGKEVFTTTREITGSVARIAIPHAAIATAGVYMVQVLTGNQATTRKLVVY